ncbi:hypothetical protein VC83_02522 [Pseudogymnoascus destructans]|uniref:Myb-like domain-containing protein n=2 Tax=Pseudogymnoascus destructans TaxID=655981 RepID=L8FM28_PSED2|nr:uncharacterized protein VC83_02522 [Pseudogymnoascus destructans]ELR01982.1 hypothetical protein GMDG_05151 [Pseudogymnoascus destructans 20631-21]OAF60931.1 hypothetical protein VC83_02522 [Pseudogymnoascus destructans]
MASQEKRTTRATSGGATPLTEPAPEPVAHEADNHPREDMASKLASLRRRIDEEKAYFNTMEEALQIFRQSHGEDYSAYPQPTGNVLQPSSTTAPTSARDRVSANSLRTWRSWNGKWSPTPVSKIGRETTYNLEFRLLDLPDSFRPSIGLYTPNFTSSEKLAGKSAHPRVCASHAKRSSPALQKQRKRGRLQYTAQEDNLLMRLKKKGLPWKEIHRAFIRAFSDRSIGSLQVRYCNDLKDRDSESDDE